MSLSRSTRLEQLPEDSINALLAGHGEPIVHDGLRWKIALDLPVHHPRVVKGRSVGGLQRDSLLVQGTLRQAQGPALPWVIPLR